MKLASLTGGRDGPLVLVSVDPARAVPVPGVAPTLQAALDDRAWSAAALEPLARAPEAAAPAA